MQSDGDGERTKLTGVMMGLMLRSTLRPPGFMTRRLARAVYGSHPVAAGFRLRWFQVVLVLVGILHLSSTISVAKSLAMLGIFSFKHYRFTTHSLQDGSSALDLASPGIDSFGLLEPAGNRLGPFREPGCAGSMAGAETVRDENKITLSFPDKRTSVGWYLYVRHLGGVPAGREAGCFEVSGSDDGVEWHVIYHTRDLVGHRPDPLQGLPFARPMEVAGYRLFVRFDRRATLGHYLGLLAPDVVSGVALMLSGLLGYCGCTQLAKRCLIGGVLGSALLHATGGVFFCISGVFALAGLLFATSMVQVGTMLLLWHSAPWFPQILMVSGGLMGVICLLIVEAPHVEHTGCKAFYTYSITMTLLGVASFIHRQVCALRVWRAVQRDKQPYDALWEQLLSTSAGVASVRKLAQAVASLEASHVVAGDSERPRQVDRAPRTPTRLPSTASGASERSMGSSAFSRLGLSRLLSVRRFLSSRRTRPSTPAPPRLPGSPPAGDAGEAPPKAPQGASPRPAESLGARCDRRQGPLPRISVHVPPSWGLGAEASAGLGEPPGSGRGASFEGSAASDWGTGRASREGSVSPKCPPFSRCYSDPIRHSPSIHPPSLRGGFPHPQSHFASSPSSSVDGSARRHWGEPQGGPPAPRSYVARSSAVIAGASSRAKRCPSGRIVPLAFDSPSFDSAAARDRAGGCCRSVSKAAGCFQSLWGAKEEDSWSDFDPNRGEPFVRDLGSKIKDLDQLYAQASLLQDVFWHKAVQLAARSRGLFPRRGGAGKLVFAAMPPEHAASVGEARAAGFLVPALKPAQRCIDKAARAYGGDVSRLTDIVRQSVVYGSVGDLAEGVRSVQRDRDVQVLGVENRMDPGGGAPAGASGCRFVRVSLVVHTHQAASLCVETHVCELLLVLEAFAAPMLSPSRHRRYQSHRDGWRAVTRSVAFRLLAASDACFPRRTRGAAGPASPVPQAGSPPAAPQQPSAAQEGGGAVGGPSGGGSARQPARLSPARPSEPIPPFTDAPEASNAALFEERFPRFHHAVIGGSASSSFESRPLEAVDERAGSGNSAPSSARNSRAGSRGGGARSSSFSSSSDAGAPEGGGAGEQPRAAPSGSTRQPASAVQPAPAGASPGGGGGAGAAAGDAAAASPGGVSVVPERPPHRAAWSPAHGLTLEIPDAHPEIRLPRPLRGPSYPSLVVHVSPSSEGGASASPPARRPSSGAGWFQGDWGVEDFEGIAETVTSPEGVVLSADLLDVVEYYSRIAATGMATFFDSVCLTRSLHGAASQTASAGSVLFTSNPVKAMFQKPMYCILMAGIALVYLLSGVTMIGVYRSRPCFRHFRLTSIQSRDGLSPPLSAGVSSFGILGEDGCPASPMLGVSVDFHSSEHGVPPGRGGASRTVSFSRRQPMSGWFLRTLREEGSEGADVAGFVVEGSEDLEAWELVGMPQWLRHSQPDTSGASRLWTGYATYVGEGVEVPRERGRFVVFDPSPREDWVLRRVSEDVIMGLGLLLAVFVGMLGRGQEAKWITKATFAAVIAALSFGALLSATYDTQGMLEILGRQPLFWLFLVSVVDEGNFLFWLAVAGLSDAVFSITQTLLLEPRFRLNYIQYNPCISGIGILIICLVACVSRWHAIRKSRRLVRGDVAVYEGLWREQVRADEADRCFEHIDTVIDMIGVQGCGPRQSQRRLAKASGGLHARQTPDVLMDAVGFQTVPKTLDPSSKVWSLDQLYASASAINAVVLDHLKRWALNSRGMFPCDSGNGDGRVVFRYWEDLAGSADEKLIKWSCLKKHSRAIEKMTRSLSNDPSRLLDLCRHAIVLDTPHDVAVCLGQVAMDQDVRIERIKNRMSPLYDSSLTAGYRDLAINFRLVTPATLALGVEVHVCELQLVLRSFAKVRSNEGHKRYIAWRNLRGV